MSIITVKQLTHNYPLPTLLLTGLIFFWEKEARDVKTFLLFQGANLQKEYIMNFYIELVLLWKKRNHQINTIPIAENASRLTFHQSWSRESKRKKYFSFLILLSVNHINGSYYVNLLQPQTVWEACGTTGFKSKMSHRICNN